MICDLKIATKCGEENIVINLINTQTDIIFIQFEVSSVKNEFTILRLPAKYIKDSLAARLSHFEQSRYIAS